MIYMRLLLMKENDECFIASRLEEVTSLLTEKAKEAKEFSDGFSFRVNISISGDNYTSFDTYTNETPLVDIIKKIELKIDRLESIISADNNWVFTGYYTAMHDISILIGPHNKNINPYPGLNGKD